MSSVVRIDVIRARAKQHWSFKSLLDELSFEYGDLILHSEIRWLRRGKILHRFLSLLPVIKVFMESRNEDTIQFLNIVWLLDLAFGTSDRKIECPVNCWLQGKQMTIADMISAVKAFKSKLNLLIQQVQQRKMQHFLLCSKRLQKMRLLLESWTLTSTVISWPGLAKSSMTDLIILKRWIPVWCSLQTHSRKLMLVTFPNKLLCFLNSIVSLWKWRLSAFKMTSSWN